jgi:hypothetical protein
MKAKYSYSELQYATEKLRKTRAYIREIERVLNLLDVHSDSYSLEQKFQDIESAGEQVGIQFNTFLNEINFQKNREDVVIPPADTNTTED